MTPRPTRDVEEATAQALAADARARLDAYDRALRHCRCRAPVRGRVYLGTPLCAVCQRLIGSGAGR